MVRNELLSARLRWTLLMSALAGTLAAIAYDPEPLAPRPGRSDRVASSAPLAPAEVMSMPFAEEADGDPFDAHGWTESPPAPPIAQPVIAQAATPVDPPPTPVAPPLPFRYMGRYGDDTGKNVIYLARADRTLIVHEGDTLDGAYKVIAVDGSRIEFEHLETHTKQTLPIPHTE